ncbi:unnamed protein product [Natator depressus]
MGRISGDPGERLWNYRAGGGCRSCLVLCYQDRLAVLHLCQGLPEVRPGTSGLAASVMKVKKLLETWHLFHYKLNTAVKPEEDEEPLCVKTSGFLFKGEDFTTLQEVPATQPGGDTESVNYWPWGEFVAGGRSWLDSWIPMSSIHQKNGSTSRS